MEMYIRLAGFDSETLLSVLFGNYEQVIDILVIGLNNIYSKLFHTYNT